MQPVNVVAMITTKPGKRDEVLTAFKANVPAVHAEKGCIEYNAVIDMDGVGGFQAELGENSFAVIEKWESMDALMAHAASDHMKAYGAKTKDMLESRTIHILKSA
ncbi:putative quinol monooxygenase [Sneathiella sp. HT1-7]|jgi:quinol monooxygenase YgiN|uniref:putative quinol monooxygenase n=1 Tax=Sneathiella sp. HT1-7 TaxID=2887192 RepID=UPI001D13FA23|nr:putative quinol monooxygenase [Sneathiella sp. HT1-7]MCC3306574.1 antibiotic biosynthesis monooxygenase [Sneathiella sp. HT1-7]